MYGHVAIVSAREVRRGRLDRSGPGRDRVVTPAAERLSGSGKGRAVEQNPSMEVRDRARRKARFVSMLRRRRSVRGKDREPTRTSWIRNIQGDWDISPDGTQVVIPNHSCGFARLRVQCLTRELGQPQERESTLPALGDLKG